MSVETESGGELDPQVLALWYVAKGRAELRPLKIEEPRSGEATLATLWSGVSRGTERLVFNGQVPVSEYQRMRAPMQDGDFPFPVKYGYCAVALVDQGPADLLGKAVFCLHPHQNRFVAPLDRLTLLPPDLSTRRAILAANMETALNAVWDSAAGPGDRIVVVGAGVLGLLVTYLVGRLPGAQVCVVDLDSTRAVIAESFGAEFITPAEFQDAHHAGADVVFHTSASAAGLALALSAGGLEARIVELSWYGDGAPAIPLGGAFHSSRLRMISSQVGHIAATRRPRWSYARRLAKALELLDDDRLDALITGEVAFDELPEALPQMLSPGAPGLATAIRY